MEAKHSEGKRQTIANNRLRSWILCFLSIFTPLAEFSPRSLVTTGIIWLFITFLAIQISSIRFYPTGLTLLVAFIFLNGLWLALRKTDGNKDLSQAVNIREGLVISLLSVTVVFVGIELWLRLTTPVLFSKGGYINDPLLSYRVGTWSGGVNSRGFRDREHPLKKASGVYRILALGDSFAFGVVPLEENYLTLLEAYLNADQNTPVEVINAGVPGYNIAEEYQLLVNLGLKYEPDLIMLNFFVGNDFGDVYPTGDTLSDFKKKAVIDGRPRHINDLWIDRLFVRNWYINYYLQSLQTTAKTQKALKAEQLEKGIVGSLPESAFMEVQLAHLRYFQTDGSSLIPGAVQIEPWLLGMRDIATAQGADFVIVAMPAQIQVESALQEEVMTRFGLDPTSYDFKQPQNLINKYGAERNIAVVDLLPVFLEQGKNGGLYAYHDTHWNKEGNLLAAETIYTLIYPFICASNLGSNCLDRSGPFPRFIDRKGTSLGFYPLPVRL
jgi:lysophospholipase L1-like esterase